MSRRICFFSGLIGAVFFMAIGLNAQNSNYRQVNTYVNPVLPGDHPDPTLLKVGSDFYHCGSSFHFNPYMPVYHSKDLVHWEIVGRVLPPEKAGWVEDRPSGGTWQGAITYFYGSYWIYFSSGGQWFCKADSPLGPWSDPVRVKSNPETGPLGYDNSIFVDDDGTPYMVIKNGQKTNRLQALGRDGQLTGKVIDLDWINGKLQYSWAEGPVMCKRNGYYFYFPAGDVSGGQYVLRTRELTSDSTKWERLGDFFKPVTDPKVGFRRPNHISAPIRLDDGTWWTIGQSYERYDKDDWSGTGRQTSLYPVIWEGDRPWGMAPVSQPIARPNLPQSGILWRSMQSDDFDSDTLSLNWHFLSRKSASAYSLSARKGWITLLPEGSRTHVVQKETDHFYTAVTKLDFNATDSASKAGIYLTNGNQKVIVRLYAGYDEGKKIVFSMDNQTRSVDNVIGDVLWLKVERYAHRLTAFYSHDGEKWMQLGEPIGVEKLDCVQPNFNSWVGTSVGLFAEGKPAAFDFFRCKDAFSSLPAVGKSNWYGVEVVGKKGKEAVTNTSENGGWFMISGVDFGKKTVNAIEVEVMAKTNGLLEIWLDDLTTGKRIATIPVSSAKSIRNPKITAKIQKALHGHHDVFVKFPTGNKGGLIVKTLRFL